MLVRVWRCWLGVFVVYDQPPCSRFSLFFREKLLSPFTESVVAKFVRPFHILNSAQASIHESVHPFQCVILHVSELYTDLTFEISSVWCLTL